MKTIKDLKQMVSEPASKEWFKKHGDKKANSKAIHNKKAKKHENNLFESTDRTIKRIREGGYDSRYGN